MKLRRSLIAGEEGLCYIPNVDHVAGLKGMRPIALKMKGVEVPTIVIHWLYL
jgi:hypothetical protein